MNKTLNRIKLNSVLALMLSGSTLANAFDVEHEAHVHGHANLNIVVEGKELQLAFTSPAMNIVGFEHQARTHEDKHKVENVVAQLKKANMIFSINSAAGCEFEGVKVSSALLASGGDAHGEHKGHHAHHDEHDDHGKNKGHHGHHDEHDAHGEHKGHHGHHDEHDDHGKHKGHHGHHDEHGDHDKHKGHHGHHDDHESEHSEFEAEYHYECHDTSNLVQIESSIFKLFPSLEEVEAKVVGPKGQKLIELNAKNSLVKF